MPADYEKISRMLSKMIDSAERERVANFKKHPWKKSCLEKCVSANVYFNRWTNTLLIGYIEALQNVKNNLIGMHDRDVRQNWK